MRQLDPLRHPLRTAREQDHRGVAISASDPWATSGSGRTRSDSPPAGPWGSRARGAADRAGRSVHAARPARLQTERVLRRVPTSSRWISSRPAGQRLALAGRVPGTPARSRSASIPRARAHVNIVGIPVEKFRIAGTRPWAQRPQQDDGMGVDIRQQHAHRSGPGAELGPRVSRPGSPHRSATAGRSRRSCVASWSTTFPGCCRAVATIASGRVAGTERHLGLELLLDHLGHAARW